MAHLCITSRGEAGQDTRKARPPLSVPGLPVVLNVPADQPAAGALTPSGSSAR